MMSKNDIILAFLYKIGIENLQLNKICSIIDIVVLNKSA